MNKTQATQVLDELGHAVAAGDMTEREVMTEILQAWAKMPPQQIKSLNHSTAILKSSAPQLGDRGMIELMGKLGMFLKSQNA